MRSTRKARAGERGVTVRVVNEGVATEFDVLGSGPPVLLLHGFPDTGRRLWRHQAEALVEEGYRVVVPDLRGYGRSDKPSSVEAYGLVTVAGDVLAMLDELGIERAHVVGHDWGAALSWVLGTLRPERVDHLAVLAVGHPRAFADAGLRQLERSWYTLLFQFEGIAERWLTDGGLAALAGGHPDGDEVRAELLGNGSLTPALQWYRANLPPDRLVGPPLELPPVVAPTLGIWGTRDAALTEVQMTGSAAHVTGPWRYERIEGAGHWMQLDHPEEVNRLLLDFLPRP